MNFLANIPQAVRESIAARLDGNETEPMGLRAAATKAATPEDRAAFAAEVNCLERLGCDLRMKAALDLLLSAPGTSDARIEKFVSAAWIAHRDYYRVRAHIEAAKTLTERVKATAAELAEMLHQVPPEVAQYLPPAYFSFPALIECTEHAPFHGNVEMWRAMRAVVLGAANRENRQIDDVAASTTPANVKVEFVEPQPQQNIDAGMAARDALRYAWGTAPDVAHVVAALGRAASERAPAESGFVGDAIASRKKAPKAEYLRAFLSILRTSNPEFVPEIIEAIAITATVVLNSPEDVVVASEVRNALRQLTT